MSNTIETRQSANTPKWQPLLVQENILLAILNALVIAISHSIDTKIVSIQSDFAIRFSNRWFLRIFLKCGWTIENMYICNEIGFFLWLQYVFLSFLLNILIAYLILHPKVFLSYYISIRTLVIQKKELFKEEFTAMTIFIECFFYVKIKKFDFLFDAKKNNCYLQLQRKVSSFFPKMMKHHWW